MILDEPLLVILVRLVDQIPTPPPAKRKRGHPKVYSDRLFLKALIIMMVKHLHKVHELLSVLEQPTAEMQTLCGLLTERRHLRVRQSAGSFINCDQPLLRTSTSSSKVSLTHMAKCQPKG